MLDPGVVTSQGPAGSADALLRALTGSAPGRRCPACGSSAHGRPVVAGFSASLAHAPGLDIVAVARGVHVGVDAEASASVRPWLADGVRHPDDPPDADLTALWVRKEAGLKTTGEGLRRPMSSLRWAGTRSDWTLTWPDGSSVSGTDLDLGPGYVGAVCSR